MKSKIMLLVRTITFAAIFFSSLPANAQAYYKFLDNTAWYEKVFGFTGTDYYWYHNAGDTMINGINYKIIRDYPFYKQHYAREDTVNKKVYLKYNLAQPEYVLYDFSVAAGSSLIINGSYAVVDSIGSFLTPLGYRNIFYCNILFNGWKVVYIEGVGSPEEPFMVFNPVTDPVYSLVCSYIGTQQSYYAPPDTCPPNIFTGIKNDFSYENNFTISPMLASEFITITIPPGLNIKNEITITDVNGKKIFQTSGFNLQTKINISDFSKGIYFIELNNGTEKAVKKFIKI
jgi:hypothetical protein